MQTTCKHSKQRDAILALLRETYVHPSAEWVYSQLKGDYPSLSLATVYRNLNRFCESGDAIKIDVGDGTVRYDGRVENHGHFFCTQCNRVLDIKESEMTFKNDIESRYSIKVDGYSLVLRGKCPECK